MLPNRCHMAALMLGATLLAGCGDGLSWCYNDSPGNGTGVSVSYNGGNCPARASVGASAATAAPRPVNPTSP